MAENEEDYLDGLLKSMSERENAEKQAKDEEEEERRLKSLIRLIASLKIYTWMIR